ncbi:hypothetical protein BN903_106 [Halorubrum sp. AJ67]|nr:hypothetical protein BN903_106 [Halorubrum sp. AJ67]
MERSHGSLSHGVGSDEVDDTKRWRAPPRPHRGRGASREGVGRRSNAEATDEAGEA